MQRRRFIQYATLALVLLGAPAWLVAQEPAKKDAAPVTTPAAATEKAQPPANDAAKGAAAAAPEPRHHREMLPQQSPRPRRNSSISHFSVTRHTRPLSRFPSGLCC